MTTAPTSSQSRRLGRTRDGRPPAPVRILHLGLGNFFRAHGCWYTDRAPDASEWGIAAFAGRSVGQAAVLAEQDYLYTLVVKEQSGSGHEVISSLSRAHAADDQQAWLGYFESPRLAIVTSTVTEAGYCRNADGGLDAKNPDVRADLRSLQQDPRARVTTPPGRFAAGLLARRAADAGPLTFLPCDNVVDNGEMVRRIVTETAERVDSSLATWIGEQVSFVTTMVDRITPRGTEADHADLLSRTGVDDPALVVTEPFSEWVLAGDFRAGRPAWDQAGATFVEDIEPHETRKLWLLNGSHSLMAYAGSIRGHQSVAEAVSDPIVRGWVEQWWDDAQPHLRQPAEKITAYRAALIERFANPRIRHLLAQIAADGSQKIPIRILPALQAERAAGRMPTGAVRALAAWVLHLRGVGAPVNDPEADRLSGLVQGQLPGAAAALLTWLGIDDAELTEAVVASAQQIARDD